MYSDDFKDKAINVAIINMYSKRTEDNVIRFTNFSFRNKSHLAILNIAKIAHDILNLKVELVVNPIIYSIYKKKYKLDEFCSRAKEKDGISINSFITYIEVANNTSHLFEDIYKSYYKRKSKKEKHI